MKRETPRVSIGMPVYNGARTIRQAIDSLLSQDYADFELIISDNASEDETYDICLDYAKSDDRVRLYRNESNLGAAFNYNHVFHLARGEYFKWACHDDWCAPQFLSRCIQTLDANPAAALAFPGTILVEDDGSFIRFYDEPCDATSHSAADRFLAVYWDLDLANTIFGVMRADILQETRLHPAHWEGDKVLLAELALRGPFVEVPEALFYRRIGPRKRDNRWFDPQNHNIRLTRRIEVHYHHIEAAFLGPIPWYQKLWLSAHVATRFLIGRKGRRVLLGEQTRHGSHYSLGHGELEGTFARIATEAAPPAAHEARNREG